MQVGIPLRIRHRAVLHSQVRFFTHLKNIGPECNFSNDKRCSLLLKTVNYRVKVFVSWPVLTLFQFLMGGVSKSKSFKTFFLVANKLERLSLVSLYILSNICGQCK